MKFVHGTSSSHLDRINEVGLRAPNETGNTTEKRDLRMGEIHVLDDEHIRIAGAYALRATHHFGGEPVVVTGEVPDAAVKLAIKGKKNFPDIYTVPYVPPDNIHDITVVDIDFDEIPELFKGHKTKRV
ncbi:MAG TPA: hypothetical protein VFT59_05310 [Candidatus Saccharimonadales bacterium]|nr:hypothetical protein [Candidatus Saccharimonadales bacterium]